MTIRRKLTIAIGLLIFSLAGVTVGSSPHKLTIRGRIIAYQPIGRASQLPSFVQNQELYLFEPEDRDKNKGLSYVKLYYKHFGYTEVTAEVLDKARILELSLIRQSRCDQTYAGLLAEQQNASDRQKDPILKNMYKLIFTKKFEGTKLAPDLQLKCYVAGTGDLKIVAQ